jgi:SNF2 family DNA or RNA helicase
MEFRKLDGSVKQKDRELFLMSSPGLYIDCFSQGMPMVDQFNGDPKVFVFLISIMAGGVGLNLVGANKVVIFDPNWSTRVYSLSDFNLD